MQCDGHSTHILASLRRRRLLPGRLSDALKLLEAEIIKMFLLWEFAWRNQVMTEHGGRYFFWLRQTTGMRNPTTKPIYLSDTLILVWPLIFA
jgi:hypothetical protein